MIVVYVEVFDGFSKLFKLSLNLFVITDSLCVKGLEGFFLVGFDRREQALDASACSLL